MNFIEKKIAYDELFGASHIEADKQLLQKLAPQHKVLRTGMFDAGRYAADLLWALLDVAFRDDIVQNRRAFVAAKSEAETEEVEGEVVEAATEEVEAETEEVEGEVVEAAVESAPSESKKKGSKSKSTPK